MYHHIAWELNFDSWFSSWFSDGSQAICFHHDEVSSYDLSNQHLVTLHLDVLFQIRYNQQGHCKQ